MIEGVGVPEVGRQSLPRLRHVALQPHVRLHVSPVSPHRLVTDVQATKVGPLAPRAQVDQGGLLVVTRCLGVAKVPKPV